MSGFQTHSAEYYADVLSKIMQTRLPSEQMEAVNILLNASDNAALQAIIDRMSEEDLEKFIELQNSINDGTYYTMNKVSEDEKQENADKPNPLFTLMNAILFNIPNPEEIIEKINSKLQEKSKQVSDTVNNASETISDTISDTFNFVMNTYDNIKLVVGAVLSNNEISDDDKSRLVKHLYNKKGYLLMKYEDGEFKFDSAINMIIFDKVLEIVRNKHEDKEEVIMSQPTEPFDYLENAAANALQECASQKSGLRKTQSCPGNIQPNEIKHMQQVEEIISNTFYGLLPRSVALKRKGPYTNYNKKQKTTGGKSRRKIRRNKKAKTKKRKDNKKTKKRKMKRKTNMNRKKSKKRRTKK